MKVLENTMQRKSSAIRLLNTLLFLLALACTDIALAQTQPTRAIGDVYFDAPPSVSLRAAEFDGLDLSLWGWYPVFNRMSVSERNVFGVREVVLSFTSNQYASFSNSEPANLFKFTLPGLPVGSYILTIRIEDMRVTDQRSLEVSATGSKVTAESYNIRDAFGLGSRVATTPPAGWLPADSAFFVWPASGPSPASAREVHRLSHPGWIFPSLREDFLTTNLAEVALLRGLPGWTYDGITFRVLVPEHGTCAIGTVPVYRAFRRTRDHRYTPDVTAYREGIRTGEHIGEGIVFCAPPQN